MIYKKNAFNNNKSRAEQWCWIVTDRNALQNIGPRYTSRLSNYY